MAAAQLVLLCRIEIAGPTRYFLQLARNREIQESLMHRREFIQVSSAAVLGLAVGGLFPRDASADALLLPLLAIGYADALPLDGRAVELRSAGSLLTGDPTFISSGARVTLRGSGRSSKGIRDKIGRAHV